MAALAGDPAQAVGRQTGGQVLKESPVTCALMAMA